MYQRGRRHAQQDVERCQEARHERGRVAERHAGDVGGQPEIGVEHGLHHLQRVAAAGQVVGDHMVSEAHHGPPTACRCPAGKSAPAPGPATHAAPADVHRRRIQVRHRRPALQVHMRVTQGEGVDGQGQHQQPERGRRSGSPRPATTNRTKCRIKRPTIREDPAQPEWGEVVVKKLRSWPSWRRPAGSRSCTCSAIAGQLLVEPCRRRPCA